MGWVWRLFHEGLDKFREVGGGAELRVPLNDEPIFFQVFVAFDRGSSGFLCKEFDMIRMPNSLLACGKPIVIYG